MKSGITFVEVWGYYSQWRTQKIFMGGSFSGNCICCALLV